MTKARPPAPPTTPATQVAPTSALDHGYAALAAGDAEGALRWAVPALADDGAGAPAADLVGRALVALGREDLAADALELAVARLVRAGLVAHAVAAALALRDVTRGDEALRDVARAFGADAKGAGEARPPALGSDDVAPLDAKLAGPKLVDRAAAALASATRPAGEVAPQPRAALWSALPSAAFERFARALTARVVGEGTVLMREGEAGQSAFLVARGAVRVTRGWGADELAVLGPGAIVGEMALVTATARAATATVSRAAVVLEAPRDALDAAAAEVPALGEHVVAFCRRRLVDNVLRTSPLLRRVPAAERDGLAQLFEARVFDKGQALIEEGATGAGLHLVAAGRVEVRRSDAGGETLRIAGLGPGDCVGEISLVLRRPATASVVATEPAVSLVLPSERFLEAIKERPTLLAELYELAVRREDETLTVVGQRAEEIDSAVII